MSLQRSSGTVESPVEELSLDLRTFAEDLSLGPVKAQTQNFCDSERKIICTSYNKVLLIRSCFCGSADAEFNDFLKKLP